MKLVLLDIDGTILVTRGSGRSSMEAALAGVLGRAVTTQGVSFSGRTDRQILRDILRVSNVDLDEEERILDEALEAYQREAPAHLHPSKVTVFPGVRELIEELHQRADVCLGLLTGNLETTAFLKLGTVGLDRYFSFGAFGSDHEDRNCLPPIAMDRARSIAGRSFDPGEVYVIGDTSHDVICGQVCGCRTVAVCTGRYTRAELQAVEPDLLVDDFSDYGAVIAFICGTDLSRAAAS